MRAVGLHCLDLSAQPAPFLNWSLGNTPRSPIPPPRLSQQHHLTSVTRLCPLSPDLPQLCEQQQDHQRTSVMTGPKGPSVLRFVPDNGGPWIRESRVKCVESVPTRKNTHQHRGRSEDPCSQNASLCTSRPLCPLIIIIIITAAPSAAIFRCHVGKCKKSQL